MILHTLNEKQAAQQAAGKRLSELFASTQTPILLLVSGGSALAILSWIDPETVDARITLGVLDERITQQTDARNLFQLRRTDFYRQAIAHGAHVLDWNQDTPRPLVQHAERYEALLRAWRQEHPDGLIVATLGVGKDGHTAGIMPFPDDAEQFCQLFNAEAWITGYAGDSTNPFPQRVSASLSFLGAQVAQAVVYVSGEEKRPALERLLAEQGNLEHTPARVLCQMKNVEIFTDIKESSAIRIAYQTCS